MNEKLIEVIGNAVIGLIEIFIEFAKSGEKEE